MIDTISIVLNQIRANLDKHLLDKNKFVPEFFKYSLVKDVVKPIIDMFRMQSQNIKIDLKLYVCIKSDVVVYLDKLRTQ